MKESPTTPAKSMFVIVQLDGPSAVRVDAADAVAAAAVDAAAGFGHGVELRFYGGSVHDCSLKGPVFDSLIYELSGWPLADDAVVELIGWAHEPLDGRSGLLWSRVFNNFDQLKDQSFYDDSDHWYGGRCRWAPDHAEV